MTALARCLLLVCGCLLVAAAIAPFVFQGARHLPIVSEYPFRRVFNRTAEILVIAALFLGWRWLGVRLRFRPLLRTEQACRPVLAWFAVGLAGIAVLVMVQAETGFRVYRDRTGAYLLQKLFSAACSAAAVGLLEELIFRGYILQAFLQRVSRFKALAATSALFSIVHLFTLDRLRQSIKAAQIDGTHYLDGFALIGRMLVPLNDPGAVVPALVGLFLCGWLLGELTLRTRTLWAAIGLHAGWVFAIQFLNRIWKYRPAEDAGPAWFFGEKFAATGMLGWVLLLVLIVWVRRRMPVNSAPRTRQQETAGYVENN